MASIKKLLKQRLIDRQHKVYEAELSSQNETYDYWIRNQEKKLKIPSPASKNSIQQMSIDMFCQNLSSLSRHITHDILVLTLCKGTLNKIAIPLILKVFDTDNDTVLIYGDEDTMAGTVRSNPWFKPDWSPDRFLSGFYFGSLVAVRTDALKSAYLSCQQNDTQKKFLDELPNPEKLYLLLFEMMKMQNIFARHLEGRFNPVCHIPQILYHSSENGYEQTKDLRLPETAVMEWEDQLGTADMLKNTLLSVIIPSKDNPDVLFRCLDSMFEKTEPACAFEIVIVDNGSSPENRNRISQKVDALNQNRSRDNVQQNCHMSSEGGLQNAFQNCRYLYEPMPFNFSRMCNLGASDAKGQLLLFLNDDVEIIQRDWMRRMTAKALLPYAGAVGAKLLYPNSDTIQHAGVTNIRLGPAHKLQFLSDSEVHYFGMNRGVHDMLAVTGACLMTRREVYEQCGGFSEALAVAFNDVDLCYTMYEKGYYNIVRNDVTFYHHESLSRGSDNASEEKQRRHLKEKDTLYERHPDIYGHDPFYHPYLATDVLESEYFPVFHYYSSLDAVLGMGCSPVKNFTPQVKLAREDKCLTLGMEIAMDIGSWLYNSMPKKRTTAKEATEQEAAETEDSGTASEYSNYYFQGYAFVIGADNACYERMLLLKSRETGKIWGLSVENQRRPDIKKHLRDQTNVELTGFAAKLRNTDLAPGTYRLGMLMKDKCSRQRLVNWSNWTLEIADAGKRLK